MFTKGLQFFHIHILVCGSEICTYMYLNRPENWHHDLNTVRLALIVVNVANGYKSPYFETKTM